VEAKEGWVSLEDVYGKEALALAVTSPTGDEVHGVRMVTAAPEVEGVMQAIKVLSERGIIVSIGHRYVMWSRRAFELVISLP
jgi:N-acetylglucosamine-6-phosphate deacetylase